RSTRFSHRADGATSCRPLVFRPPHSFLTTALPRLADPRRSSANPPTEERKGVEMGRRARLAVLAAAGAAIAGLTVTAALAAGPSPAKKAATGLAGINFVSTCAFSHEAMDDPIVYPGQPGKSHDHTFVGNVSTDASSTLASLQAAGTTCRLGADKAGYWMPTLIADGQPVEPLGSTIYYRRSTRGGHVTTFPAGFKMIAGDSKATT